MTLNVSDNGIGISSVPSKKPIGDAVLGIGISGMRERVTQLGGEFSIESSQGLGTTIRAALPLTEQRGSN